MTSKHQRPVQADQIGFKCMRMLSLEERGLYASMLWEGNIPLDRSIAAKVLSINKLQYVKVLNRLIENGVVMETADGIVLL